MSSRRHRRRLPVVDAAAATPPQIKPNGEPGAPLFSVMIPTFNCAVYLRETLASVLAQDLGPELMHIEVVDDCSGDDPEAVVREFGDGRVEFFRPPTNQGAIANFNTCVERSRGTLVHVLHGDDWVLPGFYDEIRRLAESEPEAGLYATRVFFTDEHGVYESISPRVPAAEQARLTSPRFQSADTVLQFAGCVARRASYEAHGGFLPFLPHTADWEQWTRLTAAAGLRTSPHAFAAYRRFAASDTGRLTRTAGNVADIDRSVSVALLRGYDISVDERMRRARQMALAQSVQFRRSGDRESARANGRYWRERATFREVLRTAAAVLSPGG